MQTVAKHPRSKPKPRSKAGARPSAAGAGEVRTIRRKYGISQLLLSRLLNVSLRTVSASEPAVSVPSQLRRSFTQTNRLCVALNEAMAASFVGHWLDQPNEMLAGLKPVEAIERGQIDLVWQVVEGLRSGSPL